MAVWSIIKKSELEGALRLDAEYYQPKYFRTLASLERLRSVHLADVAKPTKRRFKPVENKKFNYIEISEVNISTGAINVVNILGKEAPSRAQWVVREGDIIVSTVRPIRNAVALVTSQEDGFICSSGFAVLKPASVSPEFLFTYLKTKSIVELLDRKTTATMYPAVSWQDVFSTPVFRPDKNTENFITKRVQETQRSLRDSESLYRQAEEMLLKELGLDKLRLSQPKYYTVKLSQAREFHRLDAEHFQPKYDKLIRHLTKNCETKRIGEILAEPIQKGVTPDYVEEGSIVVVNSQHLGNTGLNFESTDRTIEDFWEHNKRAQIRNSDVMVYATGAYIGRTNVYLENEKAVAGVDILLVRPSHICNPLYLSIFLNAYPGITQAEKFASGSGQRHIYPEDIARFIVPLLPQSFQEKIADLLIKSHQARQQAKALLEEAKRKVEALIEGKN